MHSESGLVFAPGSKPLPVAEKPLPELFREAAKREAELGRGYAFDHGTPDGAVELWLSFTEDHAIGMSQHERVLGLLLLAEVIETA